MFVSCECESQRMVGARLASGLWRGSGVILGPPACIPTTLLTDRAPSTRGGFRNGHKTHFLPRSCFLPSFFPLLDPHLVVFSLPEKLKPHQLSSNDKSHPATHCPQPPLPDYASGRSFKILKDVNQNLPIPEKEENAS